MTANQVATVVRCADMLRHLHATLASIQRQDRPAGEIVIAGDALTPPAARDWLSQLCRERGFTFVEAAGDTPGAARNAGIRATTAPYVMCIDAGDCVSPSYHSTAAARFEADENVGLVTSPLQWLGPGSTERTASPLRVDMVALVEDAELVHNASVFRRQAWVDLGGFDETLPALESYEFWLRLLARGQACSVAEDARLIRPRREHALYRRAWERDAHAAAFARVLAKHAPLFADHADAVLFSREQEIGELATQYRHAVARRDNALREIDALKARAEKLRKALPSKEAGAFDLGDFGRTTPAARDWGYERGKPVDRYYIERFLERHSSDIHGAVLEVQEADYTRRYGGDRVTRSDVLDLDAANPRATVVADLRCANNIPSDTYDCIILTQTIHVVDDMPSVVRECLRILKPGGVLLATLPSASRVCLEYGHDGDFWRVTEAGAREVFAKAFAADRVEVEACGNVLVNAAFLYGLGCQELSAADFEAVDPYFPLIVSVRASKPAHRRSVARARSGPRGAAVLLYHRIATPASDVHGISVSPRDFRAHMAIVRERYRPMPLREMVAAARSGGAPAGAVAVTFDDGYVDNYAIASPVLTELGIPATFFVTSDRLDDVLEYWWDVLERILISPTFEIPATLSIELPDGKRTFATRTDAERTIAHAAIHRSLAAADAGTRDAAVSALVKWSGMLPVLNPDARRMRSHELLAMADRQGHTIGAHSVRHLMLPRQSPDVQREEVAANRRALESLLSRQITEFAYPYGAYDEAVMETVRAASFEIAVTCDERNVLADTQPYRVPRFEVTPARARRFGDWLEERFQDCYLM